MKNHLFGVREVNPEVVQLICTEDQDIRKSYPKESAAGRILSSLRHDTHRVMVAWFNHGTPTGRVVETVWDHFDLDRI